MPPVLRVDDTEKILPIRTVAQFLGRTTYWVRWAEKEGFFVLKDNSPILPTRLPHQTKDGGHRRYSYKDVEDMADALFRQKRITKVEHSIIKARVLVFRSS
jgi:hypothetical protein